MNIGKSFVLVCAAISSALCAEIDVGVGGVDFDYNEYSQNGTWLDSESSSYSDINAFYLSYKDIFLKSSTKEHIYQISCSYAKGKTDYNGYIQNIQTGVLTPYKSSTDNAVTNLFVRYILQYDFVKYKTGVFASIGYRDWRRDSNSIYGYNERYHWPYGQIGIMTRWDDRGFGTGFDVAYQRAVNPKMKADLMDGMRFDLGTTDGFNLAIPLYYRYSNGLKIGIKFEYDMWDIEKSNVVNGFVEPRSETRNKIFYANIGYEF